MIVYYKLNNLLESKNIKKIDIQRKLGISPSTMANFNKNKYVAMSIIDKLCCELNCQPGDIMEYVDESKAELAKLEAEKQALEEKIAKLIAESK